MIGNTYERKNQVYDFNEQGKLLFTKLGTLLNATAYNVSIKLNNKILIYNYKGKLLFSKIVRNK